MTMRISRLRGFYALSQIADSKLKTFYVSLALVLKTCISLPFFPEINIYATVAWDSTWASHAAIISECY